MSRVDPDLCCSVCIDLIIEPHILRCGHSFCHLCVDSALNTVDRCPLCRMGTQGICIPNRQLEAVVIKGATLFNVDYEKRMVENRKILAQRREIRLKIWRKLEAEGEVALSTVCSQDNVDVVKREFLAQQSQSLMVREESEDCFITFNAALSSQDVVSSE